MEQQSTVAAEAAAEQATENTTRVMFIDATELPPELREKFAEIFGAEATGIKHNRRSTDKVAAEKPTLEEEKATAARVLRTVADKQGLMFTVKEIDALTLISDTFSPNFAALCADLACYRFRKEGWV